MGQHGRIATVIGPDGTPLSIYDLPRPDTGRWVVRRKAEVVAAVKGGLITLDRACEMYSLTVDEYLGWQSKLERHGLRGLRITKRDSRQQDSSKTVQLQY